MKITELLAPECVVADLNSEKALDVIKELSECFAKQYPQLDQAQLMKVLLEREKLGSTGIGDGVAIPHGKIKGIEGILAAFGRSRKGIDFQAIDEKPTHLFFLLIAPENSAGIHLKALARISRLLKDPSFRQKLIEAPSESDLYRIIIEEDEKL